MASQNNSLNLFITLIINCLICFNYLICVSAENTAPNSNVVTSDWILIESGWPIEDYLDEVNGLRSQFYFIKEDHSDELRWTLNASYIQPIPNQSQYFKISFKYWSHYKKLFGPQVTVTIKDERLQLLHDSYTIYEGQWMACEYVMSYQNLSDFAINLKLAEKITIAFKDLKIEYETQSKDVANSFDNHMEYSSDLTNTSEFQINGWEKFMSPPDDDGIAEFLYFSEHCNESCVLKLGQDQTIGKTSGTAQLTFKYWIEGIDTEIVVSDLEPNKSTSNAWSIFNGTFVISNLEVFNISVTTIANKDSFVAIRDLEIEITFDDNSSVSQNCKTEKDCKWDTNESYFWSKQNDKLTSNLLYFYPISENNSLTIIRSDRLNETNVCFSIEYWVSNDKDIKLNVKYNVEHEKTKDTILKIRPKAGDLESTYFCLRDLIALNAEKYSISFNVEQYSYENSFRSFVLRIEEPNVRNEIWSFADETQTFLRKMENNSTNNWHEEWTQLSLIHTHFELRENSVHFSAKTSSKIPASAHLISKWIKYDRNLHSVEPQFRINVSDTKLLTAFTVRPKVCDWLSHCTDVQLKTDSSLPSLTKTYTFNFPVFENCDYIKLLFYVEYFHPNKSETELTVDFELELLHFGDPCYKSFGCGNYGKCVSDHTNSIPNKPTCTCTVSSTRILCNQTHYCLTKIEDTETANDICKVDNFKCESLSDTFRCLCDQNDNVIWNGTKCVALDNPELDNWVETDNKNEYYPNNTDNSIKFHFKNINTTKYDVCVQLQYQSNQTVQLNVDYVFQNQKENHFFETTLLKTSSEDVKNIFFCVRDFRYVVHEDFELKLRINGIEIEWNPSAFLLTSFEPSVRPINKRDVPYIERWDLWNNPSEPNPALEQYWRAIPKELFVFPVDLNQNIALNISFNAPLSSETQLKALLISDWIINNSNYDNSENFYALKYTNGSYDKNFKLEQKVIYYENDELKEISYPFPNSSFGDLTLSENNKISIPTPLNSPFKIIFEITCEKLVNENENDDLTQLDITFEALSLGDPCFGYKNKSNVCKNDGQCTGLGPELYLCECNDEFGGNNCEFFNACNNENEFDNNMTNEEYCASLPSLPNSDEKKCKVLANDTFECKCPTNDYFWRSGEKRCGRNGYLFHNYTCNGNNCELFNSILTDTQLSNKNLPVIQKLDDPILPFYYSNRNNSKLKLDVNNLNDTLDACFRFNYFISQNSSLEMSYNDLGSIALTQTQALGKNTWFPSDIKLGEELCVRSLAKQIDTSFNITFNAVVNNNEDEIIALRFISKDDPQLENNYIEFRKRNESLLPELPFLVHWSTITDDDNYSAENQWQIRFPRQNWQLGLHDNTITFSANSTSIQQKSYLFSNWLNKGVEGYILRFKIISQTYQNFSLSVYAFDDQMHPELIKQIVPMPANIHRIPIDKIDTYFRVGFIVDHKLETDAKFTLESIDLGDPCVSNETIYNTCTDRGVCKRNAVNNYTCQCNDMSFIGKNCEQIDYCYYKHNISVMDELNMTGEEYCKDKLTNLTCVNGGYSKFHCDCGSDKFWNFNKFNCSENLKCVLNKCDLESTVCKEPNDHNDNEICECREGFVRIDKSDVFKCVKFNPCDQTHRDHSIKYNGTQACQDDNAQCVLYGFDSYAEEDDYMCVCPHGFKASGVKSETSCKAIFCSFPTLNECRQICKINETSNDYYCECEESYVLDGKYECVSTNNTCNNCTGDGVFCGFQNQCKCKNGYNAIEEGDGKYKCEPNLDFPVDDICPYKNVTNTTNNKLACDCGQTFTLNTTTNTCQLKPICGIEGDGRKDCDSRNAICVTDEANLGNYECLCSKGKRFDDPKSVDKTCIDVCDFGNRKSNCSKIHAECNPSKIALQDNEDNDDLKDKDFCHCYTGNFGNDADQYECLIGIYTAQFNLRIKNTFRDVIKYDQNNSPIDAMFYFDLMGFANELKSKNEQNFKYFNTSYNELKDWNLNYTLISKLEPILIQAKYVNDKNQIDIKKCSLIGGYYECIIALYLDKPLSEINSDGDLNIKLGNLCINITESGETQECFFLNKSDMKIDGSETDYLLIIDRKNLSQSQIKKYMNCDSGTDICSEFSTCTENESSEKSLYNCSCNDDYFTYDDTTKPLPTWPNSQNQDAIQYTCRVKTLCPESCPKENGKCVQSLPYKNSDKDWVAPVFCSCEPQYNLTSNNTCIGVCTNENCNHGKCVPKGMNGYACQCDHGWSGENCDSEFEPSLGGWIAGITVLAVLVIVGFGVAFIFARRAKNTEFGINNSHQQMDDYSATSYRVGQTGQVVAHGQTPYQGNNNRGFIRD